MSVGPPDLAILFLIVLLIFGSTKVPKLARSLGEAQREFRQGQVGDAEAPLSAPAPEA